MLKTLARWLLAAGGWTTVGPPAGVDKAVLIAAPHTSNWDGFWSFAYLIATRFEVHFFAKKSLFWFPLGSIIRALGGVPLDRERPGGAVQHAVDLLTQSEQMVFGLSPEGTRSRSEYWRTGFYRIAEQAGVPLVLAFFDYERRRIGIGPVFKLSGNRGNDIERLADFYAENGSARNPERVGPVRFDPDPKGYTSIIRDKKSG